MSVTPGVSTDQAQRILGGALVSAAMHGWSAMPSIAGSCDGLGGSVRGDRRLDRGRWLVTIVGLASQHSDRPVSAGPPQVAGGLSCVIAFVASPITSQNVKISIFVGRDKPCFFVIDKSPNYVVTAVDIHTSAGGQASNSGVSYSRPHFSE